MAQREPYVLVYARAIRQHLQAVDVKYRGLIRAKTEEQLELEPGVETRNRKALRQPAPFGATWEIRFGPHNCFRVLYDILEDEHEVHVLAVGVKDRERLLVGGEEVEL